MVLLKIVNTVNPDKPTLKSEYSLYDYQIRACKWMKEKEKTSIHGITGGIISLSMGLGKTLIALHHTVTSRDINKEEFPTLIVASKTVMYEWKISGASKFYDGLKVLYFHQDFLKKKGMDTVSCSDMKEYDLVITTYDLCVTTSRQYYIRELVCEMGDPHTLMKGKIVQINTRDKPMYDPDIFGKNAIYQMPWERVFCDESQRFSNPKTKTYQSIMALYGKYKWCLTGTPVKNYDTDIWSQLRFCGFDKITIARLWKPKHFKEFNLINHIYSEDYVKAKVQMPELINNYHYIDMDPNQFKLSQALLTHTKKLYEDMLLGNGAFMFVLAMFTRLRQSAIAPYLIVSPKKNNDTTPINNNIQEIFTETCLHDWVFNKMGTSGIQSPKIQSIVDIIRNVPKGDKILIFSMLVSCLELAGTAVSKYLP